MPLEGGAAHRNAVITQTTAGPAPSRGRDYFSQPGASRVFVAARGLAARCPARSSEKE